MKDIFWINEDRPPHLAIVMRPRGDDWLQDELQRMKQGGIQTVVSLLEPFEADMLGLSEEKSAADAVGLNFLNYPIPDRQVPEDVTRFRGFAQMLADRLSQGERIGVHCRGCIGRATITAACALIHLGLKASEALAAVEKARGLTVPDTPEQEEWILSYGVEA